MNTTRDEVDMSGKYGNAAGRWARCLVILVCVAITESVADSDYHVYRSTDTVRFERRCADAEAYRVQACAELVPENAPGVGRARRTRALVDAYGGTQCGRRIR